MTVVVELPRIPKLECPADGKIGKKELDAYFKNIGRTMGRLNLSVSNLDLDDECSLALIAAAIAIEQTMKPIEGVTTDPFQKLKSKELEYRYRARELFKDIEEYFKKSVVEILLDVAKLLGIPNPFEIPIPFIGTATLLDAQGNPYQYDPVIADLFTKEGQRKVKQAIREDIEEVKKFFGDMESVFNGDLGIKSLDLEVEELWHKIKNWFGELINDFIGNVANAIAKAVKSIPIIGKPIYDLITAAIDPTITVEQAFNKLVAEYKAKIKKAKEDFLSGKAIEDFAEKLLDEAIERILAIRIPLIGTIGDLIDVDPKKKDVVIKVQIFHELEDAVREFIQKARRFFKGGLIVKINDIIAKAPGYILSQFPIVGKIFNIIKKVADILSGKNPLTECEVLRIIFPAIFSFGSLIENLLPDCIEVVYVE
jgi:hypothetical protein